MSESPERDTFRQVVLFLVDRAPDKRLGVTKLWKLVYYVDVMHVEQFGRPVTGIRFTKERHGPVPETGSVLLDRLAGEKVLALEKVRRFEHYQLLCRALVLPTLHGFDFSERAILEEVALDWMQATTTQLEAAIRESRAWKAVSYGEGLPVAP